jgi:hypothetical protein
MCFTLEYSEVPNVDFAEIYKKVMDEAILAHRRKLSKEINNLKSSNSQEFWKLLKKGKTREQP